MTKLYHKIFCSGRNGKTAVKREECATSNLAKLYIFIRLWWLQCLSARGGQLIIDGLDAVLNNSKLST